MMQNVKMNKGPPDCWIVSGYWIQGILCRFHVHLPSKQNQMQVHIPLMFEDPNRPLAMLSLFSDSMFHVCLLPGTKEH